MGAMGGVLDGLDDEQRAAAMATTGPVCIVAGAGTGKTRTVTHRLAHAIATGAVRPGTALAVTHSKKAAAELGERLGLLGVRGVDARTFHSAALRVLKRHWRSTGRKGAEPVVLDEDAAWGYWRQAARAAIKADPDNAVVRDLRDEVGWARSRLVQPEEYEGSAISGNRHPGIDLDRIVAGWSAYERSKQRVGVIDFADQLEIAAELLERHAEVATDVRRAWAYVTVDEYQDTDPAQQRLLNAILAGNREICVVGDPRQAIYSFKGADSSFLTGFQSRYPDCQVFPLTRNYRSSPEIITWANAVASNRWTKPLVATRPSGPRPRVVPLNSEAGEATWVAKEVVTLLAAGTPPNEVAILYRYNAMQARFEASLAQAGVPTIVAEDTTFFDREDVRSVLVPFGVAARREPERGGLELLSETLGRSGFDRDRAPEGLGAARERWEALSALVDLAESQAGGAKLEASSLLAALQDLARRTHGPRDNAVTLATLHRAKGLEWDVVFIIGVSEGTLPSSFAQTPRELAEEERLFHVGVSRARRQLHVSWTELNSRGWTNRGSQFLELLPKSPPGRQRTERRGPAATTTSRSRDRKSRWTPKADALGPTCAMCTYPLRFPAARRLGICGECAPRAPGRIGDRARAIREAAHAAAEELGLPADKVVSRTGLLRLLDQRPQTPADVTATPGVQLDGRWAEAVAAVLSS